MACENVYAPPMTEARARYEIHPPRRRRARPRPLSGEAAGFPGCDAVRLTAAQLEEFDRHIEYWDERSGVAWVVREPSIEHERPGFRLAVLVHRIGQVRGAPIVSYGAMAIENRTRPDNRQLMAPDQAVFMDARRAAAQRSPVLVEAGDGPDVVLEVDYTTDIRRRKRDEYEAWRVQEVWMAVPIESARRRPGVTIYALDACTGRYREAEASEVLLGWTTAEIHQALNEPDISAETWASVLRVGRALGERDGTEPLEDPLHGSLLRDARAAGTREGRAEGREAAMKESLAALAAERAAAVRAILARRHLRCPPGIPAATPELATADAERVVAIAFECSSVRDLLNRLRILGA